MIVPGAATAAALISSQVQKSDLALVHLHLRIRPTSLQQKEKGLMGSDLNFHLLRTGWVTWTEVVVS